MNLTNGEMWEKLGELDGEESTNLLTFLFTQYEAELEHRKSNRAQHFFALLGNGIEHVCSCNLNRR